MPQSSDARSAARRSRARGRRGGLVRPPPRGGSGRGWCRRRARARASAAAARSRRPAAGGRSGRPSIVTAGMSSSATAARTSRGALVALRRAGRVDADDDDARCARRRRAGGRAGPSRCPSGVTGTCRPSSILSASSRAVISSTPLAGDDQPLAAGERLRGLGEARRAGRACPSITRVQVVASAAPAIAVSASSGET